MTDEEGTTKITLGEVYRSNERLAGAITTLTTQLRDQHHDLADSMTTISNQQASFNVRIDNTETDMRQTTTDVAALATRQSSLLMRMDHVEMLAKELKDKVEGLMWKAAAVSGAVGVAVFVVEMIWKH